MFSSYQDYKKTQKLTWLAEASAGPFTPTVCVHYDHIISKAIIGKDEDFKQYINANSKVGWSLLYSWCCGLHSDLPLLTASGCLKMTLELSLGWSVSQCFWSEIFFTVLADCR